VTRSFAATMGLGMGLGAVVCVAGLAITWIHPLSPGATVVALAVGVYALVAVAAPVLRRRPVRAPAGAAEGAGRDEPDGVSFPGR
jgi:ABC-type Mn2+/Zn2+ transport system permease subunit